MRICLKNFVSPLATVLLAFLVTSCQDELMEANEQQSQSKFAAGEHQMLGDDAFTQVINQFPDACRLVCEYDRVKTFTLSVTYKDAIGRPHDSMKLSYGTLIALADFYESPEALWNEKRPETQVNSSNLIGYTDLPDLKKYFLRESNAVHKSQSGDATEIPEYDIWYQFNAVGYLDLLLKNHTHFGWNNLKTYSHYHGLAIDFAFAAFSSKSSSQKAMLLRQALHWNGFADHFLTDAFAAGHIRVPRMQIDRWAAARGKSVALAGALVKVLHDNDGGGDFHAEPLNVLNSRGDLFQAAVDGELGHLGYHSPASLNIHRQAVELSLKEVLHAFQSGNKPLGVYAATQLVPFVSLDGSTGEVSLQEKFSKDLSSDDIDTIFSGMSWLTKVGIEFGPWSFGAKLQRKDIRELFSDLPKIMAEFRRDIRTDLSRDGSLVARIAKDYLDAMTSVE